MVGDPARRPMDYFPHRQGDTPLFPGVSRDVYEAQQELRWVRMVFRPIRDLGQRATTTGAEQP